MRSHPADTLVSLGGQRVARAAAKKPTSFFESLSPEQKTAALAYRGPENHGDLSFRIPASEAEAWKDPVEALTDYGPRHPAKPKPLSDRMNVGE